MDPKRRLLLTEPGEDILLSSSAPSVAFRYGEWIARTGLTVDTTVSTPICSVPLPKYMASYDTPRRFTHVPPELMWHPLFWLPARLYSRYPVSMDGGPAELETDEVWAIRVSLELKAAGLFDPDTGWVDIMDAYGLDVEDDFDLARIEEWQNGNADPDLDRIDLEPLLKREDDVLWSLQWATALLPTLQRAQWAILADSLIEVIDEVASPDNADAGLDKVLNATAKVAMLAGSMLYDVPVDGPPALEFWTAIEDASRDGGATDIDAFIGGPVTTAAEWLYAVRDRFWESIAEVNLLNDPVPA